MSKASRVHQRMYALSLAQACAELGARVRTIHHLSGLPPREIQRLCFSRQFPAPRGRAPDTREWYHTANVLDRSESSLVAANVNHMRRAGFAPAETLVAAYRYYQTLRTPPHRISFDRAFDLVANTEGLWIAKESCFRVVHCTRCGSAFLDALNTDAADDRNCPFCPLIERHVRDPRLTAQYPECPWFAQAFQLAGHRPKLGLGISASGDIPSTMFAFQAAQQKP